MWMRWTIVGEINGMDSDINIKIEWLKDTQIAP